MKDVRLLDFRSLLLRAGRSISSLDLSGSANSTSTNFLQAVRFCNCQLNNRANLTAFSSPVTSLLAEWCRTDADTRIAHEHTPTWGFKRRSHLIVIGNQRIEQLVNISDLIRRHGIWTFTRPRKLFNGCLDVKFSSDCEKTKKEIFTNAYTPTRPFMLGLFSSLAISKTFCGMEK